MMLVHIDESLLMHILHMIGIYLVHGWMHLLLDTPTTLRGGGE
jgi:hypothetical protein